MTAKGVFHVVIIIGFIAFALGPIAILIHRHGWGVLF